MMFSDIFCVFCQCLLLCCIAVCAQINRGIVVHFGKNIRPARIENKDRVVLVPSSPRLRCFAKCVRDPRCSKCIRYDDDGAEEEAVKEVVFGWQPHIDDYVLKCATVEDGRNSVTGRSHSGAPISPAPFQDMINKSSSLILTNYKFRPSRRDIQKSLPPTRVIDKSTTATLDINKSTSSTADVHKSPKATNDVSISSQPSKTTHQSPPPSKDIHQSPPPSKDIHQSPPPSKDIHQSPPPSKDIHQTPSPSKDIHQSEPPSKDIHQLPPPSQVAHQSQPPSQGAHQSKPPFPDVNQCPTPFAQEGSHGPSGDVSVEYKVVTETGTRKFSNTDSYMYLTLYGVNDSDEFYLNHDGDEMGIGQIDTFRFSRRKDLGCIRKMEIRMEPYFTLRVRWFCVSVEVERRRQYTSYTIVEVYSSSVNRWLPQSISEFEIPQIISYNLTKHSVHPN